MFIFTFVNIYLCRWVILERKPIQKYKRESVAKADKFPAVEIALCFGIDL